MYLNEQIPMVCLGCLENKYFSLDLIFPVGWFSTKPSGSTQSVITTLTTGTYVPPSLYLFQFSGTGTSTPPHDTFGIREYVHTTLSILLRYLNVLVL
jgi:hypothetical protein